MQVAYTFRNVDSSEVLKDYAREKLERINKYFPDPIKAHIVFSSQRGYLFDCDVQITLHNGLVVKSDEATEDMHSSIDLVMAKIERQLRRFKDRIRDHKPQQGPHRPILHSVVSLDPGGSDEKSASGSATQTHSTAAPSQQSAPRVIREQKFVAAPMTVEEAIMRMNLQHDPFLVFHNVLTHEINVVYRRNDETYGLIETTQEAK
jgi:putative sigma-54 modulation protein